MQRGKSAKDERGVREPNGVRLEMEKRVDSSQAARRAFHCVVGGSKAMDELVPGGRTGQNELNEYTYEVHVPKCACPKMQSWRSAEEEEECGDDKRESEVYDTVREPGDDVENGMGKPGENI